MPKLSPVHQALKRAAKLTSKANKAWSKVYTQIVEAKALSQQASAAMIDVTNAVLASEQDPK